MEDIELLRMNKEQNWPDLLWLVRHGQSAGNVARDRAELEGLHRIELETRDVDVPLSPLGERQARALGTWFGQQPAEQRPTVILTSPYIRARSTAHLVLDSAGLTNPEVPIIVDERLREREFGVLDGLTKSGIMMNYPEQDALRKNLGKFYHRPPGGENWCDVILRLRNVIDTVTRDYRRERVMVVCHQVVVFCFRYLLEQMTEDEILTIDSQGDIANCGVTSYAYDPSRGLSGGLSLQSYNYMAPLEESDTTITAEPDAPIAPR